jgi:hypothetical protein
LALIELGLEPANPITRRNPALKVLKPELAAVVGAERFLANLLPTTLAGRMLTAS